MSSTPLILVATVTAKKAQRDALRAEMIKLLEPTRAESGCIQYDFHEDLNDPNTFLFYEIWETREHWLAHLKTDHLQNYSAVSRPMLCSWRVFDLSKKDK